MGYVLSYDIWSGGAMKKEEVLHVQIDEKKIWLCKHEFDGK